MTMTPAYDLAAVQTFVRDTPGRVVFRRAFTIDILVARDDVDEPTARRPIREAIRRLTDDCYAHTLTTHAPAADVYGWHDHRGRGWYIKFAFQSDGRLFVISFHPPTTPLRTQAGVVRM